MPKLKPVELAAEARRRNAEQLARLGALIKAARRRRRLTQRQLGAACGLSQPTVCDLELGRGGSHTLDSWQRIATALGIALRVDLSRDPNEDPVDAGHLAIQELVLRVAKAAGYTRRFELAAKPSDPSRSTDVGLIHPGNRLVVLAECINTLGDIGGATRSSDRKRAEADALSVNLGGDSPFRVGTCWVVRDLPRNRRLVAKYPEIFATRFPGSSAAWLRALTLGTQPPDQPGLIWTDARSTRLFAVRHRGSA